MRWLPRLIAIGQRLLAFGRRRRLQDDIQDELAFHLEMKRQEHERAGLTAAEARLAAHREFGNVTALREEARDMWTFPSFDSFVQDVRFALRMLVRVPGFTAVAVSVLALGIGSTTAMFSLIDAMFVRGLPYSEPDRLVLLVGNVQRQVVERRGGSYLDYLDWRDQASSFESMAAYVGGPMTLGAGGGDPERVLAEGVSAPYFHVFGVEPVLGRVFRSDEDEAADRDAVVVIGHGLWQRRFGGDRSVVGRTMRLDGRPTEVIGVMPAGFTGVTDQAELWVPFVNSGYPLDNRGARGLNVLARLRPGVSAGQAQADVDTIAQRLEAAYPATNEQRGVELSLLSDETFGDLRPVTLSLMGAVSFVLLIACANVANLLIGRSEARQQEIAVRTALGAGRLRLLRQLATESCVLAALGAVAGVALASLLLDALVAASPVDFPSFVEPGLNRVVLAFTTVAALACGLVLGAAPAVHTRLARLDVALKDTARGSTGAHTARLRAVLVASEVALAVVLLVGAGLLIRTAANLMAVDPGFETGSVLTMNVAIPAIETNDGEAEPALAILPRDLLARLTALPGVVDAALSTDLPLAGGGSAVFYAAEGDETMAAESRPRAYYHRVTSGFFSTMGIPVLQGRTFLDSELTPDAESIIVSENVVRRFWPDEDPIGRRIRIGSTEWSIVGVVAETLYRSMPANPTDDPDLYLPYSDRGVQGVVLRTAVPPVALAEDVRATVRAASPDVVVYQMSPMSDRVAAQSAASRFTAWLMGLFAGAALLLAVVGIYGVMSYLVTRRTRELGIRMALGAGPREVVGVVFRDGARLVGLGLALGVAAALGLSRLVESLLFDVSTTDPSGFAAIGLLAVVALAACLVPALRATRVDPVVALRSE